MISNWFYYCLSLLATISILSSCLDSNDSNIDYGYSADAQITSLKISSRYDSLRVLSDLKFSINQVSSTPIIYNRDSLPYLFDVSIVEMDIMTNGASGIKFFLNNPDSSYIWNLTDSVQIKRLKQIEVYAQDGTTKKTYDFKMTTHQQDPDTIFWQNITSNYISSIPTDQITVSDENSFYTYHKTVNTTHLSTSPLTDGELWTDQPLSGLPENVVLKSIRNQVLEENKVWLALDTNNKVYVSENGMEWAVQFTDYPVTSILGKLPSYTKDSVLAIVKDGDKYKFAKTIDFTSIHVFNEVPLGFPVKDFTFTTIKDSLIYTAKYMIVTGGSHSNNFFNNSVWLLQEGDNKITYTSKRLKFNVTGSSLFKYNNKVYMLTSENNKNELYTSSNYGVHWEKASSKQSLPNTFTLRNNQSVNVDNQNNIWIFGGVTSSNKQLVEVWKGRINRLFIK